MIGLSLYAIVYTVIFFLMLTWLGNHSCRALFSFVKIKTPNACKKENGNEKTSDINGGRVIGSLERILFAIGIIAQSWEIFAAVIALKSVGRFKELDDKDFAECFLIGSLFSILWAIFVTVAWLMFDHYCGVGLADHFAEMVIPQTQPPS